MCYSAGVRHLTDLPGEVKNNVINFHAVDHLLLSFALRAGQILEGLSDISIEPCLGVSQEGQPGGDDFLLGNTMNGGSFL